MSQTEDALVARGVDTHLAKKLYEAGATLGSLQQKSVPELEALGLLPMQIEAIRDSHRPAIPVARVHKLLWESRYACVICRGANKSAILHHIVPWAQLPSHDETNLVVLCLEHHGEVHTSRELSLNITPDRLRDAKERWLAVVRADDARRMTTSPAILGQPHWDYLNFVRLEPILREFRIDAARCRGYDELLGGRAISASGALTVGDNDRRWRLQHFDPSLMLAFMPYMTDRIRGLLEAATWRELPKCWNKTDLAAIPEGSLFVDYGGYRFRSENDVERGVGQTRDARRQADQIAVSGTIDAYDAVSTSAHSRHLSGSHRSTSLGFVRGFSNEEGVLVLDVTFLAFGTGFGAWSAPNSFVQQKVAERESKNADEVNELLRRLAESNRTPE